MLAAMAYPECQISLLAWLEGAWRGPAFGGIMDEVFSCPAGGCILGVSRVAASDGQLIHKEFIELAEREGKVSYRVTLPDKTHSFGMAEHGPGRAVWTDPDNDFPSRMAYTRDGDVLEILLEGRRASGEARQVRVRLNRVEPGP